MRHNQESEIQLNTLVRPVSFIDEAEAPGQRKREKHDVCFLIRKTLLRVVYEAVVSSHHDIL